jgi:hypothetical protein
MADLKKDTVRIALPIRPEQAASDPSDPKQDTTRIVLPSRAPVPSIRRLPPKITPQLSSESTAAAPNVLPRRPPVTPLASPTSSSLLQPLPKPSGIEAAQAAATNMTETLPLLIHPTDTLPVAPAVITSKPVAPVDAIPHSLAWGLLGISAVIFLIQIWNYVVS